MNKIADYDTLDYDYSTYWKKREYEHKSEELVLKKILKNKHGKRFIDIGGSFGRLTDQYFNKYEECVIVDYSLKTLQNNYEYLSKQYPNINLIAANAYYLPFKDNSFDGGLMVRVLHHIDRPKEYFKEANRIFNSNATYIQEFANKTHLKAVVRAILKGDYKLFNDNPYQQPDQKNHEGAREGSDVPFLNYTSKWISRSLLENNFETKRKFGCSFFRINSLKKLLGTKILLILESFFQMAFSWSNISPSIFLETTVQKEKSEVITKFEDILVCPKCKAQLTFNENKCNCKNCKLTFTKSKNIWDFRI